MMSKLVIAAACVSMALPAVTFAHDHDDGRPCPPRYGRYVVRYAPPPPPAYYYAAPRYRDYDDYRYYGGYHHHHHENDDALWAIGGLMLGVAIGNAIDHSVPPPRPAGPPR